MLRRQRTGSVICTSCGALVGVDDDKCYNCGRRNPGLWGFAPLLRALGNDLGFVPFVIGACAVVYTLTLIWSRGNFSQGSMLSFLGPSSVSLFIFGASGAVPVFQYGRWWTVLSAAWLHAGLLHILFNMMAVRQLAPPTADFYGPGRMVIIYTAGAIAGFTLSSVAGAYFPRVPFLSGSSFTVGASASISGLIGALMYYGRRSGSGIVKAQASQFVLMLVVYGFLMPGIDNYAHAGGFGGGYVVAMFLDPLTPERGDHLLIAVICLAASIVSVVASVISGLRLIQ
jgi:membrane associated rhomboid family serine protease